MICCTRLYNVIVIFYYNTLSCIVLYCIVLYHVFSFSVRLYYSHSIVLYGIELPVLYYIILCNAILYNIIRFYYNLYDNIMYYNVFLRPA